MKVAICKMGKSRGVIIPERILERVGLARTADLQVRDGVIEIRAIRCIPCEGWADEARRLAEAGDDWLILSEFSNKGDAELIW